MKVENIKFKAKRLDNNTWVEGYFYAECGNTYIIEDRQSESMLNRNGAHQVDPSTVCQFTGLKDCKGNEIWEGDIISSPHFERVATVKWMILYVVLNVQMLLGILIFLLQLLLTVLNGQLLVINSIRRSSV